MKTERWAFTQSELEHPCELTSLDELVASVKFYCEETGNTLDAVIIYRNGTVSNRWADGTAGIPELIAELAGEDDSPYHPETGELADTWRNVEVDDDGRFVRFLPVTPPRELPPAPAPAPAAQDDEGAAEFDMTFTTVEAAAAFMMGVRIARLGRMDVGISPDNRKTILVDCDKGYEDDYRAIRARFTADMETVEIG